ncbi:MAG: hypothetical protein H3C49_08790 [Alphaproteobacteria bacterium]|nr:hypothetical protein [Alphaproteobacteria bacterium]
MLQKIKDFWNNPYAAPLTKPLDNIAMTVLTATGGYVEAVMDAFNDKYLTQSERERSRISRIYGNIFGNDSEGFSFLNGLGAVVAAAAAGITAGVSTWTGLAGAGVIAKVAAAGAAGVAVGTVGALAAPIVLATAIASVALVVGTVIGVVPGVIGGTAQALKHHKQLKNPAPAPAPAQTVAAVQPSAKAMQDATVLRICDDFRTLPAQTQQAVIERLERSASAPQTPQQKMIKAIDNMTEEQRVTLAEMLEEKLATAFDTVASKRAAEAGTLDEDISVKPIATKLRRRNAAPAGGAA